MKSLKLIALALLAFFNLAKANDTIYVSQNKSTELLFDQPVTKLSPVNEQLQLEVKGQTIVLKTQSTDFSPTNLTVNTVDGNQYKFNVLFSYDDYSFPGNTFGSQNSSQSNMIKGLPTGNKTNILGTTDMLLSVMYYDKYGRVVQSKSQNHLNGTDVMDNTYNNITGELLASIHTHTAQPTGVPAPVQTTIATAYTYDHMGRKLTTTESINGANPPTVLSSLAYNEIGQLKDKTVGNNLNTTSYTYNERGWLKSQTNGAPVGFNMTLKYNDATDPLRRQYNGNIANQVYTNGGSNIFSYQYDKLNRLTVGEVSPSLLSEVLTYDVMGNITSLSRDGTGANIYTYKNSNKSNQLQSVAGVTLGDYDYDGNGNATTDGRNGVALEYNFLNLPKSATKTGVALGYTYDATGRKLSKNYNGTVRNYVDGIEYNGSTIDIIHTEEGIARNNAGIYSYEYNLTDHLGNVRVSFTKNINSQELDILQRDDYYAFGKRKDPVVKPGTNKYLYNGKEIQDELGGQYDYGARFYDPVIGRFTTIDPHSDRYVEHSPYNYVSNNPLIYIDPTGKDLVRIRVPDGNGGVRFATVDSKIARQAYDYAWAMYEKYGVAVTESYRTDEQQRNVSGSGGMKGAVGKSRHQQGFALDFGVNAAFYKMKGRGATSSEKTEVGEHGESLGWDWRYGLADYPHFELTATDYGYSSLQEAYQVNKDYYNKVGGEKGIPVMSFDNEKKTVTINGKEYETIQLTKDEVKGIVDYLKTLQEKKKKEDEQ